MALVLKDRVQETCTSPGTGDVSLLGATTGYQTFSSAIGNNNTCYYAIADQGGANWEVGLGTYVSTGNVLERTTVLSSSAGGTTKTNFSSGTQAVFVTYPAEKSVNLDGVGNVSALGTISSGTWTASTIAVSYGGTGATTSTGSGSVVLSNSPALTTPNLDTPSAIVLTNATGLPLATGVSGTLPTGNGGTGLTSFTANGAIYATSTSALTSGTLPVTSGGTGTTTSTGTGNVVLSTSPTLVTPALGAATATSIVASNGFLTTDVYGGTFTDGIVLDYDNATQNGRISVHTADTLTFYTGGLGNTAFFKLSSTGAIGLGTSSNYGSSGQVLTSNGSGAAATWTSIPASTYTRTSFSATAGQTSFSLTYVPGYVEVFVNGVMLNAADYTASNGTTVVLSTACAAGDVVETVAFNATSIGTASAATNISGGIASQIPYQAGPGSTAFIANGTSGQALISAGTSAPAWGTLGVAGGGTGVTTSTGSGANVLNNSPALVTPTTTGGKEIQAAVSASNIDLATANYFTKTISGTTTFTISNTPASGTAASFILDLTNGGSATVTWWSGVKWAGGTAPTLTSAGRDALGFYTYDGGTTWTGLVLGKDIK